MIPRDQGTGAAADGRRPRDLRRDLGRHAHHPRAGGGQAGGGDRSPRSDGVPAGSVNRAQTTRASAPRPASWWQRSTGSVRSDRIDLEDAGAQLARGSTRQPRRSRNPRLPVRLHALRPRRCWAARWPACSPEPRVGRYRARSASWTHRPSLRPGTWWRSSGAAIPRSAARWWRSAPTTITRGSSRRRWTTIRSAPSTA